MTLHLNIFGDLYEDTEPCFMTIAQGTLVYNRIQREWVSWESLNEKAVAEGYVWKTREVGIPSQAWQAANTRVIGQYFAPGLNNTSGLASEVIDNGEVWTGAPVGGPDTIPPTGWAMDGQALFQFVDGSLHVYGQPSNGGGISQTLTMLPDAYYVLEVSVADDISGDVSVTLTTSNTSVKTPIGNPNVIAGSFKTPSDGIVDMSIHCANGAVASIKHIRCYLESELTGSGGSGDVVIPPEPEPNPVVGPFTVAGTTFWIDKGVNGAIGFNLDDESEPDIWMGGVAICQSTIKAAVKLAISERLVMLGFNPLPCITGSGNLNRAAKAASDDEEE